VVAGEGIRLCIISHYGQDLESPFNLLLHLLQHPLRKIMMLVGDSGGGFLSFVVPFSTSDQQVDMGRYSAPDTGGEWQPSH
jgi:hypothetical protein